MKKQIIDLINGSNALSPEMKKTYVEIIPFLPEKVLIQLRDLLQKEQNLTEKIKTESDQQKKDLNKKFLPKIKKLYKDELKIAMKEQENSEDKEAENILKKLENSD